MAFSLDLEGSGRFGDSTDELYKEEDKGSEVMNFTWEKTDKAGELAAAIETVAKAT